MYGTRHTLTAKVMRFGIGVSLLAAAVGFSPATISQARATAGTIIPSPITAMCQIASPNPGMTNTLQAVSAVSARDVWAVGYQTTAARTVRTNYSALTMHFDGANWQIVETPKVGDTDVLSAVYSLPGGPTFAVGQSVKNSFAAPVMLQYDGKGWSLMPSDLMAATGGTGMNLTSVIALSASDVWAVGYRSNNTSVIEQAVALHYDGTSWKNVEVPRAGVSTRFSSVAALSAKEIYAVGTLNGKMGRQPLFMRYDGEQWSRITVDLPGTLSGVAAVDGAVYAVGEKFVPSLTRDLTTSMLAIRYNPILDRWTTLDTAKFGTGLHMNSVSAYGGIVYFAGYADNPASYDGSKSLIYSYNGQFLSQVRTPVLSVTNRLKGIAATEGDVWAVGEKNYFNGPGSTYVLHSFCTNLP